MKKRIVSFFILMTILFFFPRLMKADPFVFISSEDGTEVVSYSEEEINRYRKYYGLDQPLWKQYINFSIELLKGNLGYSIYFKDSISGLIFKKLIWTAGIVTVSICMALCIGLISGCISAWYFSHSIDSILHKIMTLFSEIPAFLTATAILMFFIITWKVLPTSGGMTPFLKITLSKIVIIDIVKHSVLPVITLSLLKIPDFYFVTRSAMLRQLQKKYTETARAKSLSAFYINCKHCLPNAANPIITRFVLGIQTMFNGSLIIENVFNYPGIGKLIREAVLYRDYLLLQGILFIVIIFVLFIGTLGDYIQQRYQYGELEYAN